jgi:hypothetical protein
MEDNNTIRELLDDTLIDSTANMAETIYNNDIREFLTHLYYSETVSRNKLEKLFKSLEEKYKELDFTEDLNNSEQFYSKD